MKKLVNNRLTVGIIDYGLGNLYSIESAIKHVGAEPIITSDPKVIARCERLILPGVGAFGDGIGGLKDKGLIEPIKVAVESGKPLLGVCLGMQLLMSVSEEFGIYPGLDLIKGKVVRFKENLFFKIPHVGWNSLDYSDNCLNWRETILEDLEEGISVYFVHSYIVVPDNLSNVIATTDYADQTFCSVIADGNIVGCQFHPERSGEVGLEMYRKFIFKNF